MKNTIRFFATIVATSLFLVSCETPTGSNTEAHPPLQIQLDSAEEARKNELQKIFFSIPSPVEMAALIKEKGYRFDLSMLNKTENVDRYTGETRQAVNLGIYGADLSYA